MISPHLKLSTFFLPLSLILFAYVVLRACHISFTHDEASSYNLICDKDYFAYTANNHLLNTLLMGCCAKIFGESELALRLPNVLLFAIYLFFCFKLIQSGKKNLANLFVIPLLLFNPFVLDFFALARGYGLSLGFMMGSLYFFLKNNIQAYDTNTFFKNTMLSMLFATLALLSNLVLINFYIALLALFVAEYATLLFKGKKAGKKVYLQFCFFVLTSLIPLYYSLKTLLFLNESNGLYTGANNLDESISSFIERFSYSIPYPLWFTEFLQTFIELIFPIGCIIMLFLKNVSRPLLKISLLIGLITGGIYLEHFLFGALFPMGRTGIYFFPLFGLFTYYLLIQSTESITSAYRKPVLISALLIIALPLTIHFLITINLSHSFEWKYETHTKEVVLDVNAENKEAVLGHNWIFGPTIHYYIKSRKLNLKAIKLEEGTLYNQDFIYEFQDQLKQADWEALKLFNDIKSGLYKNPEK